MKRSIAATLAVLAVSLGAFARPPAPAETIALEGIAKPVDILVDKWGVPHLFAANEDDLFFAQGFNAARDRLFQVDLWRRRGLGELSEVFGPAFVEQDKAARLFLYRGDMASRMGALRPRRGEDHARFRRRAERVRHFRGAPSRAPAGGVPHHRLHAGAVETGRRRAHPQPRPHAQPAQRSRPRQLRVQGRSRGRRDPLRPATGLDHAGSRRPRPLPAEGSPESLRPRDPGRKADEGRAEGRRARNRCSWRWPARNTPRAATTG